MKHIRRITVFAQNNDGTLSQVQELGKSKKKRKLSRNLKTPERNTRKLYTAIRTFVDEMEGRHDKSTKKKKDGWIRDYPKNSMKAQREALKKLRKIRVF